MKVIIDFEPEREGVSTSTQFEGGLHDNEYTPEVFASLAVFKAAVEQCQAAPHVEGYSG